MNSTKLSFMRTSGSMSRLALKLGLATVGVLVAVVGLVIIEGWRAFGSAPGVQRAQRMHRSPHNEKGVFVNPEPLWNDTWGMLVEGFAASDHATPTTTPPHVEVEPERFDTLPSTGLRVTWLGHSTLLVEIDGHRILTDPVWGERTSPSTWIGPKRFYPPPLALSALPELDAVVISHDHYDHLDYPTIQRLRDMQTTFIAPIGVGAHLAYWGVPEEHIVELDWWEKTRVADLDIVCTPARHASGRHILDQNRTQWAGYALVGKQHRVYFSGDTGLFPEMIRIGQDLGPFDLTMIEVGAYGQAWPDWHLGPEQAIRAHQYVRGRVMLPIHWGLFNLAYHGWTAPIERVLIAAEQAGVTVATPRPGDSSQPEALPPLERWWPTLPFRSATDYPIVATQVDPNLNVP